MSCDGKYMTENIENGIKTEKNCDYGFQTLLHGVFLNMDKF